jgi:hypothetical protein
MLEIIPKPLFSLLKVPYLPHVDIITLKKREVNLSNYKNPLSTLDSDITLGKILAK